MLVPHTHCLLRMGAPTARCRGLEEIIHLQHQAILASSLTRRVCAAQALLPGTAAVQVGHSVSQARIWQHPIQQPAKSSSNVATEGSAILSISPAFAAGVCAP